MSLGQALVYFFREAARNLVRSWKTSLLAILTIATSLFVGGLFLLVSQNLARQAREWSEDVLITVYIDDRADANQLDSLYDLFEEPWIRGVTRVSGADARKRFDESFPSLSEVFDSDEGAPFSASVEIEIATDSVVDLDPWLESVRASPATDMVDDDRDWLSELDRIVTLVRGIGMGVGLGLLAAAVLTIASVIKLTAYLYIEEIQVLRLVGATEFFIRGPFYAEGFLQGLVGGIVALIVLFLSAAALGARAAESFWLPFVAGDFLPLPLQILLVAGGAASGLFGALVSLRREDLQDSENG